MFSKRSMPSRRLRVSAVAVGVASEGMVTAKEEPTSNAKTQRRGEGMDLMENIRHTEQGLFGRSFRFSKNFPLRLRVSAVKTGFSFAGKD
jgi:hypothetical protein